MDQVQVEPAHYDWRTYNLMGRWVSYWHQIDEVLTLQPESCLEIGVGTGLTGEQLRRFGVRVTTVDFDERLGPDRVGDLRQLPCADNEFEVVLCSQVLEHLPWHDVPQALDELHRVGRRGAVVSLPQSGKHLRFAVDLEERSVNWGARLRGRRLPPMPGEHYWEVGRPGTDRRTLRRAMERAGFRIAKEYVVPEFTYHRFYVLREH